MGTPDTERTVPTGAIVAALEIVKMLGSRNDDDPSPESLEILRQGRERWGIDLLVEAHSMIISSAVNAIHPGDEGDALSLAMPAIVRRFQRMQLAEVPDAFLPTVAGIVTAAYLGQSPYEWRTQFGLVDNREALAWCYVAWLVVDFVDECVLGRVGAFADTLTEVLTLGPDELGAARF